MPFLPMPTPIAARRLFLGLSTGVLSSAAVALLAGNHAIAAKPVAAKLEQGAVSAYLGAVPLGDEAMHGAALRQALGEAPVPGAFVS